MQNSKPAKELPDVPEGNMMFIAHRVIMAFLLIMCLSKVTSQLSDGRWSELDVKVNNKIGPLHHLLGNDQIPSDVAADQLGAILAELLESEPEFEETVKEFYRNKVSTSLEEARILKRELKRKAKKKDSTHEDKENWLKAVKLHALLLARSNANEGEAKIRKQEKAYKKNFAKFVKEACNGTLDCEKTQPKFTKEQADVYFRDKYSQAANIDLAKLSWFVPVAPPTFPYNQAAIRPSQVKAILRSKAPNTAPGEDGLLYGVLAKLPSVHHILATLYTKTHQSSLAPASWASSLVVLAHKAGDLGDPSMFRMMALTSCLGKPYHQIKADRMAEFMMKNSYIDEGSQKAFLKGINGCIEHIQVLQEVIQDAKHLKKTLHSSYFDLSDAYGSVPHSLIEYCLKHYHVPEIETRYIMDLYSKLEGKIVTNEWSSESFKFL